MPIIHHVGKPRARTSSGAEQPRIGDTVEFIEIPMEPSLMRATLSGVVMSDGPRSRDYWVATETGDIYQVTMATAVMRKEGRTDYGQPYEMFRWRITALQRLMSHYTAYGVTHGNPTSDDAYGVWHIDKTCRYADEGEPSSEVRSTLGMIRAVRDTESHFSSRRLNYCPECVLDAYE